MQRPRFRRLQSSLLPLLFTSCTLLLRLEEPTPCTEGTPTRCEENKRVFCEGGFEFREDCAALECNAEANSCGVCGDNILVLGEECDGSIGAETCLTKGFNTGTLVCGSDCTFETDGCRNFVCGDGFLDGDEACDDNNTIPGDGCSNNCLIEVCGDSITNNNDEECDDGNSTEDDSCDSNCTSPSCGNAILDASSEECDDGNTINGDGCENDCSLPACGNDILDSGELCYALYGDDPQASVTGDFNNDGQLDLAIASKLDGTITVLLNQGEARLSAQQIISVAGGPSALTSGDFDEDGTIDLAVANSDNQTLNILLNLGSGSFAIQNAIPTGLQSPVLAAGDLDGDGDPDLVIASKLSGTNPVSISVNTSGVFGPLNSIATLNSQSLLLGNINNDTSLDIIVLGVGVSVLLNQSALNFGAPITSLSAEFATAGALADFNKDGTLDVAILAPLNAVSSKVGVLSGDGAGGFSSLGFTPTGSTANGLAAGNFNGDNAPDVATTSPFEDTLNIFFNAGDGVLRPKVTIPMSRSVSFSAALVTAGDFNQDNQDDLVVVDPEEQSARVILAQDSALGFFGVYPTGAAPNAGTSADLNNDGATDLLFVSNGNVGALRNLGNGAFAPVVLSALGLTSSVLGVGDLNNDGKADLVGVQGSSMLVFLGLGDGTFGLSSTLVPGNNPLAIVIGDFNQDNTPDISATLSNGTISVFINQGGTFGPALNSSGIVSLAVAAADFNQDGALDLALGNASGADLSVFLNTGDGTFGIENVLPVSFALGVKELQIIDFNFDGKLDIITSNKGVTFGSGTLDLLINNGNGTFSPVISLLNATAINSIDAGDFNNDGLPDLVIAFADDGVHLAFNTGNNSLDFQGTFPTLNALAIPLFVSTGDFNHDGLPDFAKFQDDNTVGVCLNHGPLAPRESFIVGFGPVTVSSKDVDQDGDGDLISISPSNSTISVVLNIGGVLITTGEVPVGKGATALSIFPNFSVPTRFDLATVNRDDNSVSFLLNTGNGTLPIRSDFPVGQAPIAIASGDFNLDGAADLATANQGDNTISILLNRGDNAFLPQLIVPVGSSPISIAAGDLNGDNHDDLAVLNNAGPTVTVLISQGTGTFTTFGPFFVGNDPRAMTLADIDGNNSLDIAVANTGADTISLLKNVGGGNFSTQTVSPTKDQPVSIAAGDFNFDGKIDLVTSSFTTRAINLLLNQGNSFAAPIVIGVGDKPLGLAIGDIDGDGAPEIVVANSGDDTLQIISAAP
jgi:cysteine-rich repeat protein